MQPKSFCVTGGKLMSPFLFFFFCFLSKKSKKQSLKDISVNLQKKNPTITMGNTYHKNPKFIKNAFSFI
jgi:hypothetical protein